ncbi:MAG TPA: HU family DNA-binding protein [Solirubrobacteraceae bacterium]|nr:HU family DNA-binding protein [Solirubrobacteraceae bacterium]
MRKAELIDRVAARGRLSRRDAARAVEATLAVIEDALGAGGEVAVSGFGRFHVSSRGGRPGVDPRTGEEIWIEPTSVPRFTAGAALKRAVRGQRA